jgi:hypothetical protein
MPAAALATAGLGALVGAYQALSSGVNKKNQALEQHAFNAPKYMGDQGVADYYQQSKQMANTAGKDSLLYKTQMQNANRALGIGLSGGRGLSRVSALTQNLSDASNNALLNAEQQRERRFNQLGQATQMRSADEMRKFQINQQQPWETKYNLLAAKAAKAAEQKQAGFQNLSGGLMNFGTALAGMPKKPD